MAEPKKDTEAKKDTDKKAAPKKAAAKKSSAKPKAAATKAGSTSAARATSKTSDTKAAKASESKTPAKSGARKAKSTPAAKKETAASKSKQAGDDKAPERPVVNARARFVRVAPRKARLIADQVRGLPLEDAQTLLRFSSRGAAQDIAKVIDSAAANAENNHDLVADDLLVKEVRVDEGPTLRRYRPRALGRATRINKRTSHIQVALTPED